ncbi:predicted protein [Lichtheimia corymbifera JMRC:FSU:9682]|uniref:Uncharacterized protein n=1 Tax=Lichtheimia corymbifera JMRC:FSU:9682 TaxID=1263082 RepID=A0A068RF54_9FUNG|nr:predicted protein [Lichtheimia corymbifera JMRC:FSU:9682]
MSTEKASLTYLKNNHNRKNFSVINFYKHFKFTNRIDGENEFKAAVGEARRSANKASNWKKWLEKAASNNFQLLRNEDIDAFWSDKESIATQEKVKHDQLKRMASSSATGPSATPVVAATIATSSELSVSTQEDDDEDGEDIDIDIDIDVNSNKDPYRSPRRPNDFFSDAAPTTLRLPAGFELGPVPDESFMIGTNNMTARFHTCKQKALQAACSGKGLQIESQTHEIAALSHVLILKQGQYSKMMVDVLGEESLGSMYYKSRALALDHDLKFPDKAFMDISNILDELAHPEPEKRSSRLTVMSKLLAIASNEAYNVSRVIFGLAMLLSKIPNMPIANATCISETELWNCFYDPLLTAILADPENDMMLRWVNTITPEG